MYYGKFKFCIILFIVIFLNLGFVYGNEAFIGCTCSVYHENNVDPVVTQPVLDDTCTISCFDNGVLKPQCAPEGNYYVEFTCPDDLIDEGTIVKKGDYVGALSKSEVIDKLQEENSQLLKSESQEVQTRLDTTIELNQARNEIKNLEYNVKEKEIILEQSIYEPPATIRQAKIGRAHV